MKQANVMSSGLNDHDVAAIRQVFEMYPKVKKVILYGARAKGNYLPSNRKPWRAGCGRRVDFSSFHFVYHTGSLLYDMSSSSLSSPSCESSSDFFSGSDAAALPDGDQ